jgi:hypothetical protein
MAILSLKKTITSTRHFSAMEGESRALEYFKAIAFYLDR